MHTQRLREKLWYELIKVNPNISYDAGYQIFKLMMDEIEKNWIVFKKGETNVK